MKLGAPILSPARMQMRHLAVFACWEEEAALDAFLAETPLGRTLAPAWHIRLSFLRRWGYISELGTLPPNSEDTDPNEPVVAVTLARMKLPQIPRFVYWGKPVETLVRDHPGTTFALAAMRPPRTVSTFSIWRSQQEMTDMVQGRSHVPGSRRHADAMVERARKRFHHEFTTLRFRPVSEHGTWQGKRYLVPS